MTSYREVAEDAIRIVDRCAHGYAALGCNAQANDAWAHAQRLQRAFDSIADETTAVQSDAGAASQGLQTDGYRLEVKLVIRAETRAVAEKFADMVDEFVADNFTKDTACMIARVSENGDE